MMVSNDKAISMIILSYLLLFRGIDLAPNMACRWGFDHGILKQSLLTCIN